MKSETIAIMITAPSMEIAEKIAEILVESKLAACVNISSPILSIYFWEGRVQRDSEYMLVIKTTRERSGELKAEIKRIHPYDLPEIVAFKPEDIDDAFAHWIVEGLEKRG